MYVHIHTSRRTYIHTYIHTRSLLHVKQIADGTPWKEVCMCVPVLVCVCKCTGKWSTHSFPERITNFEAGISACICTRTKFTVTNMHFTGSKCLRIVCMYVCIYIYIYIYMYIYVYIYRERERKSYFIQHVWFSTNYGAVLSLSMCVHRKASVKMCTHARSLPD